LFIIELRFAGLHVYLFLVAMRYMEKDRAGSVK